MSATSSKYFRECKVAGGLSRQQGVTLNNFDRSELIKMQENDPDIKIILSWISDSPRRPDRKFVYDKSPAVRNLRWNQLKIVNRLLFKRHDANSTLTTRLQLVVPKELRDRVMTANHASVMSGHLGLKKTLSRMQRSFYWWKMKETV